jgi:hypothetical protein
MWILSILFLLAIITSSLTLIVGIVLLIIGKFKQRNKLSNLGLKILLIPIIVVVALFIYAIGFEILTTKPNLEELAGKYVSSENYKLKLLSNGNFEMDNIPEIDLCENGKFRFDEDDDEIWFNCDSISSSAKIDRGIGDYKIEFVIGDPDSGESVYFEKIDD